MVTSLLRNFTIAEHRKFVQCCSTGLSVSAKLRICSRMVVVRMSRSRPSSTRNARMAVTLRRDA
eukprot:15354940-Ditylum_brightwellii.AAC.1